MTVLLLFMWSCGKRVVVMLWSSLLLMLSQTWRNLMSDCFKWVMLTVSESFNLVGLEIESMHCGNLHSSDSCFPRRAHLQCVIQWRWVDVRGWVTSHTFVCVCVCVLTCLCVNQSSFLCDSFVTFSLLNSSSVNCGGSPVQSLHSSFFFCLSE